MVARVSVLSTVLSYDGAVEPGELVDAEALVRLQETSYQQAAPGLLRAWPAESAMDAEQLVRFLNEHRYCVLATVTSKQQPQARPVAFTVLGSAFWFATVAGARLRNLQRTPWVSLVVTEGDRGSHRAVVVDGSVTILENPSEQVLAAWEERHGSPAEWAAAWFEVRPARLFSYSTTS